MIGLRMGFVAYPQGAGCILTQRLVAGTAKRQASSVVQNRDVVKNRT